MYYTLSRLWPVSIITRNLYKYFKNPPLRLPTDCVHVLNSFHAQFTWRVCLCESWECSPDAFPSPQYSSVLLAFLPIHKIPCSDWNLKPQPDQEHVSTPPLLKCVALLSTIYQRWPFNSYSLEQN